jgi:uncharacterized protein (TIGR00645 family)
VGAVERRFSPLRHFLSYEPQNPGRSGIAPENESCCAARAGEIEDTMIKLLRTVEAIIFYSRWLLAPLYLGLVAALFILALNFFKVFVLFVGNLMSPNQNDVILGVLSLIDVVFTANLVLIVIFSGYENFVSQISTDDEQNDSRPLWMSQVDFGGLKQKLITSIVAISAVEVLKAFMNIDHYDTTKLGWLVGIHMVFLASMLVVALADRMSPAYKAGASSE